MATVLDEFVTKFRFKSDRNEIKNIEKNVGHLKSSILQIGAAIAGVFGSGAFLGITAAKLDELGKFADTVGISVTQLQQLQFAAERAGVSTNDLRSSLLNINRVVGQSARGYGIYGQVLARFGVSIRDNSGRLLNSFKIFQELNKVFARLSTAQQFDLAQNLGLTPNTVKLLQQTPKEFNDLLRQAQQFGLASRRSTQEAAKFEDALTNLKQSFFGLASQIGVNVFPVMTKIIDFFTKIFVKLEKNSPLLKAFGISIATLSGAFALLRIRALAGWAAVFSPLVMGATALSAIILLLQDITRAFSGQKSFIYDLVKATIHWLTQIKVVKNVVNEVHMLWQRIVNTIGHAVNKVESLIGKTKNLLHLHRSNQATAKQIRDLMKRPNQPLFPSIVTASANAAQQITNSAANKTITVTVGGINITAPNSNAEEISKKVSGEIRNHLRKTVYDFDSGVAA